jgi:hypothetical protein
MWKAPHRNRTTHRQGTQGIDPLLTRHHLCKALCPLICKEALRLHLSTSVSEPMWTLEPPLRPDVTTGTRANLGGTDCTEAGGMTLSTTATCHLNLQVPLSSRSNS